MLSPGATTSMHRCLCWQRETNGYKDATDQPMAWNHKWIENMYSAMSNCIWEHHKFVCILYSQGDESRVNDMLYFISCFVRNNISNLTALCDPHKLCTILLLIPVFTFCFIFTPYFFLPSNIRDLCQIPWSNLVPASPHCSICLIADRRKWRAQGIMGRLRVNKHRRNNIVKFRAKPNFTNRNKEWSCFHIWKLLIWGNSWEREELLLGMQEGHQELVERAFWVNILGLTEKISDRIAKKIDEAKSKKLILDVGMVHLPCPFLITKIQMSFKRKNINTWKTQLDCRRDLVHQLLKLVDKRLQEALHQKTKNRNWNK